MIGMKCAYVNSATRYVISTIMADPTRDKAPEGFELVGIDDNIIVGEGWMFSRARGFFMGPEMIDRIEAERLAAWNSPEAVLIRYIETNADAFLDRVGAGNNG